MSLDIAIAIVTYNRPYSLSRLLKSIEKANYPKPNIHLYVSVDYSIDQEESLRIATDFKWNHGKKTVVKQNSNLGLKNHILDSTDLVMEHDAIIVLEDDLFVSPEFYEYATKATAFYSKESQVFGISLFSYEYDENNFYPFQPLQDDSSVHFIQIPCSWGQVWSKTQWAHFKEWYNTHLDKGLENLPSYCQEWGSNSWKKFAMSYMIEKNLYFVFPNSSFTTNFEEPGTNSSCTGLFLSSLELVNRIYSFQSLENSKCVYDSYFEISPSSLIKWNALLKKYDFEVDLKRCKPIQSYTHEYILTYNSNEASFYSFAADLKPIEANIALDLNGDVIGLYKKEQLVPASEFSISKTRNINSNHKNRIGHHAFCILIIVTHFDAFSLEKSLNSILSQSHPGLYIHICCTSSSYDEVYAFAKAKKNNIHIYSSKDTDLSELITYGFLNIARKQQFDYFMWIVSGTELTSGTFPVLDQLMSKYPFIMCLRGVPIKMEPDKALNLNTARYRWHKNDIIRLRNKSAVKQTEGFLYASELISNLNKENLCNILFPLKEPIYLAVINIVAQKNNYRTTLNVTSCYLPFQLLYQYNIPFLRAIYRELKKIPAVFRYDDNNKSFYQENY
jgi:hypothetical protein